MSGLLLKADADVSPPIRGQGGAWRWRIAVPALSIAAGLAYALIVIGPRVINPLNLSWLIGDPATAYLGWAFFRQETSLTIPLGWAGAIGYPLGEPIAYFDSMPLLATIGWLIRAIIPANFQYFGIYFLFCSILQFYFGYRISRRICGGDNIAGVLGGALFLSAPAFTWRALGHFALTSHWIILAALDQLLAASARPSPARIVWTGVICFVAASINPYIAAMTFLVTCATYMRPLLHHGRSIAGSCIGLGVALCSVLLAFVLFGFIRSAEVSQYAGIGYEAYSMNLLAPVDPETFGALLLAQQPIGRDQYEGYNYLGLGVLLFGLISIARRPTTLNELLSRRTIPALIVFGISLLLALSTKATFGPYVLYHPALPRPIMDALSSLRASGRLFWPGYYLLFTGIIAAGFRTFHGPWLHAALTAALIVQFFDLAPLRADIRHQWQTAAAPTVPPDAAWHELGRTQRHLVVLPPWQCSPEHTPGGLDGYAIFGRLALDQHMTINSYYAGRVSIDRIRFFCTEQLSQVQRDGLRSDTAYVLGKTNGKLLVGVEDGGNFCRNEDRYILCSQVSAKSGFDPAIFQEVVELHSEEVVEFSNKSQAADGLIGLGWSSAEPWGRWMVGRTATLVFRVSGHPRRDVRLTLSVSAFVPPSHARQRVDAMANGKLLSQQAFEQSSNSELSILIPASLIDSDGLVRLNFNLPDAVSPADLGLSDDRRELSIGLTQLRVDDAGD
jgi:Family of unknown function (DUF6311)